MKRFFGVTILILLLFICLPVWQMKFRYLPEDKLLGVEVLSEKITYSWQKWFSGFFQSNFEKRFSELFGFRASMVKFNNQINFQLFRELNASSATLVVFGKDNFLYEKGYIDNFNRRDLVNVKNLREQIFLLKKLQDELERRGILLMLLISPSKANVYPEYLPEELIDKRMVLQKSNYQIAKPLIEKSGVNYLDATDLFLKEKSQVPFTLFAKGGVHWNYYGACQVVSQLIKEMETLGKKDLINITCGPPIVDKKPSGTDKDLADLTNIFTEEVLVADTPHPRYANNANGNEEKSNVLFVGDSFCWTIMKVFESQKIYSERDFLYYNQTNYSGFGNIGRPLPRNRFGFEELLLAKNIVIIEVNETGFDNIGYGFIEQAVNFLQI